MRSHIARLPNIQHPRHSTFVCFGSSNSSTVCSFPTLTLKSNSSSPHHLYNDMVLTRAQKRARKKSRLTAASRRQPLQHATSASIPISTSPLYSEPQGPTNTGCEAPSRSPIQANHISPHPTPHMATSPSHIHDMSGSFAMYDAMSAPPHQDLSGAGLQQIGTPIVPQMHIKL